MSARLPRLAGDQRGFTLTELLITVALIGVITAATAMLYVTGNTMFVTGTNRAEAQQSARVAMMIQDDLRMIGYGVPVGQAAITAASATGITFSADLVNATTHLSADVNVNDTTLNVDSTANIKVGDVVSLNNGQQFESLTVAAIAPGTLTVGGGAKAGYPRGVQVGVPKTIVYAYDAGTQTITRDAGDGNGVQTVASGVTSFGLIYYDATDAVTTAPANIRRINIQMKVQSASNDEPGAMTMNIDVRPRNLS